MDLSLSDTRCYINYRKNSFENEYPYLDFYINQSMNDFEAEEQVSGTCYANASAAVLHLAMRRILGRQGGHPSFYSLRKEIINKFGNDGAVTLNVLQTMCPKYRLQCAKVGQDEAIEAIDKKRPIVASFYLTENEWVVFGNFFKNQPTGILTASDLDIRMRPRSSTTQGHAVMLISCNNGCLTLVNSWGKQWADNGYFKVESAAVLDLEFIDVYWTLGDLTEGEKEYYRKHGSEVCTMKGEEEQLQMKVDGPDMTMKMNASRKSYSKHGSRGVTMKYEQKQMQIEAKSTEWFGNRPMTAEIRAIESRKSLFQRNHHCIIYYESQMSTLSQNFFNLDLQ